MFFMRGKRHDYCLDVRPFDVDYDSSDRLRIRRSVVHFGQRGDKFDHRGENVEALLLLGRGWQ